MADMDRRTLLRLGILGGGAVALLPWGGRAMAGPAATAAGARQLADGPVPTGGKLLANTSFMFPDLPPFAPDPDPGVATSDLLTLANSLFDPNATTRDQTGSFGSVLTYFGQFVDHDNFLDLVPQPTAAVQPGQPGQPARSRRRPRPELRELPVRLCPRCTGAARISARSCTRPTSCTSGCRNPTRTASATCPATRTSTAILVEHRNDENEIIAQVHVAFLKFHNAVADILHTELRRHLRHRPPLLPVDRHPPVLAATSAAMTWYPGCSTARSRRSTSRRIRTPPWSPRRCRWPRTGSATAWCARRTRSPPRPGSCRYSTAPPRTCTEAARSRPGVRSTGVTSPAR